MAKRSTRRRGGPKKPSGRKRALTQASIKRWLLANPSHPDRIRKWLENNPSHPKRKARAKAGGGSTRRTLRTRKKRK